MLHPDTELRFINDRIGSGVFATRPIPRGTITWARCALDRVITQAEFERLPPSSRRLVHKYGYQDRTRSWVLCWDLGKYVNHSCRPNCLSPGYEFEIAVRDIPAGEQLTDDYGSLNLERPMKCLCGARDCRQVIRPNDLERNAEIWDGLIRKAFGRIRQVPQPLWNVVAEKGEIARVLANGRSARSILHHRPDAEEDPGAIGTEELAGHAG